MSNIQKQVNKIRIKHGLMKGLEMETNVNKFIIVNQKGDLLKNTLCDTADESKKKYCATRKYEWSHFHDNGIRCIEIQIHQICEA